LSSPQFIGSLPVLQSQLRIYAERRAVAWRRPETAKGGLVGALSCIVAEDGLVGALSCIVAEDGLVGALSCIVAEDGLVGFAPSGALRQGAARDGGLVGSSSGVHEQRQGADGGRRPNG
jgi:hypothetical protein